MKGCKAVLAVVIALMTVSLAVAQEATIVARANVPFEFSVHGTTLPAGEYTVSKTGDHLLCISSAAGEMQLATTDNSIYSATPKTESELVFQRYGQQYVLSEVWVAGENIGDSLPATKRERELARTSTGNATLVVAKLGK